MFDHPAVDTHAHVFPPQYPIPEGRGNKPAPSVMRTKEQYYETLASHGMTHGMLIQPSTYQEDNSIHLEAMDAGHGKVKLIVVLPDDTSDGEMDALASRGVIGNRWNLIDSDPDELSKPNVRDMLERVRDKQWWAECHLHASTLTDVGDTLSKFAGRIMFDHIGRPHVERGIDDPGFQRLLEFGRERKHCVKLSGAIRCSKQDYPYTDVDPFVHAVIDAFGIENCLWGSDWPYIILDERTNYDQSLQWLLDFFPDAAQRKTILWDNPSRLFGYK